MSPSYGLIMKYEAGQWCIFYPQRKSFKSIQKVSVNESAGVTYAVFEMKYQVILRRKFGNPALKS